MTSHEYYRFAAGCAGAACVSNIVGVPYVGIMVSAVGIIHWLKGRICELNYKKEDPR